jgi:hypothetical protein
MGMCVIRKELTEAEFSESVSVRLNTKKVLESIRKCSKTSCKLRRTCLFPPMGRLVAAVFNAVLTFSAGTQVDVDPLVQSLKLSFSSPDLMSADDTLIARVPAGGANSQDAEALQILLYLSGLRFLIGSPLLTP